MSGNAIWDMRTEGTLLVSRSNIFMPPKPQSDISLFSPQVVFFSPGAKTCRKGQKRPKASKNEKKQAKMSNILTDC